LGGLFDLDVLAELVISSALFDRVEFYVLMLVGLSICSIVFLPPYSSFLCSIFLDILVLLS